MKNKEILAKIGIFLAPEEQKTAKKIALCENNTVPKTLSGPISKHH
ncbi:hypothetical protein Herbaro_17155 [Herbaspirillum sp. WKF16]|nr:hypothetical protein [Herbaspirillum sp. WKF16]WDZ95202.1 hypothetical protein Herbaro_17155 [Herbaspirillum sp. WKF16]